MLVLQHLDMQIYNMWLLVFLSPLQQFPSISVEYSCLTSTATVSWNAVFGATSYRAAITDGQGRSLNCTSTDATCQISNLVCGERNTVRITAIANCESTSDGSYVFETGKDVLSQRSRSHLIQSSGGEQESCRGVANLREHTQEWLSCKLNELYGLWGRAFLWKVMRYQVAEYLLSP